MVSLHLEFGGYSERKGIRKYLVYYPEFVGLFTVLALTPQYETYNS